MLLKIANAISVDDFAVKEVIKFGFLKNSKVLIIKYLFDRQVDDRHESFQLTISGKVLCRNSSQN